MIASSSDSLGRIPYIIALLLAGGSLIVYFGSALVYRFVAHRAEATTKSFNLALPFTKRPESLFAVSLAAAQTTFSTVFIVFLTDAPALGLHFLYCPIAFAAGNWFMLRIYKRIEARGTLDTSLHSGLIPGLVFRVTNSKLVASCLIAACAAPLVAILALELHYGIAYLDYLGRGAFSLSSGPITLFSLFAAFTILLLSYVFLGGFRAVVASDIWQYKIMAVSLPLALVSVCAVVATKYQPAIWKMLFPPITTRVALFYMEVTLMNLFQPLCFATTWQRFHAFRSQSIDFSTAVSNATKRVAFLWTTLILIGVGIQLISQGTASSSVSLSTIRPLWHFLDELVGQNVWFAVFVFPMITLAGFSGMYSSADTCVAALLYLREVPTAWLDPPDSEKPLSGRYRWMIVALFFLTLVMYGLYYRVDANVQTATTIALTVFGNCVMVAPTVILLGVLDSRLADRRGGLRARHILSSIALGLITFWSIMAFKPGDRAWAILGGLVGATLPAMLLYRQERALSSSALEG